jgi:hypothetical protein
MLIFLSMLECSKPMHTSARTVYTEYAVIAYIILCYRTLCSISWNIGKARPLPSHGMNALTVLATSSIAPTVGLVWAGAGSGHHNP